MVKMERFSFFAPGPRTFLVISDTCANNGYQALSHTGAGLGECGAHCVKAWGRG